MPHFLDSPFCCGQQHGETHNIIGTMAKKHKKRTQRRRGQSDRQRRAQDENSGSWLPSKWLGRGNGIARPDQQDDGFDLVAEGSKHVREKLEDIVMRTKGFFRRTELEVDFPTSGPDSIPISNKVEDIFSKTQDFFECDASWGDDDDSEASGDREDDSSPLSRRKKWHRKLVSRLTSNDDEESDGSSGIMDIGDDFSIEYPDGDESDFEEPEEDFSLFDRPFHMSAHTTMRRKQKMLGPSMKSPHTYDKPIEVHSKHICDSETEKLAGYTHLQDLPAPHKKHEIQPHVRKQPKIDKETKSGPVWQANMLNLKWLHSFTSNEKEEEPKQRAYLGSEELKESKPANSGRGIGGEIRRKMVQRAPRKCLGASPRAEKMDHGYIRATMKIKKDTSDDKKDNKLEAMDFHKDSPSRISESNSPTQMGSITTEKPAQLVRDRFSKARQTLEKSGRQRSASLQPLNSKARLIEKAKKHRSISMEPLTPRSKMTDKLKRIRAGPKFDIINRRLRGDGEETEILFQSPRNSNDPPKQCPLFHSTVQTAETRKKDVNRGNTFIPIEAAKVTPLPESPRSEPTYRSIQTPKPRISYAISPSKCTLSSQEKQPESLAINETTVGDDLRHGQLSSKTTVAVANNATISPKPLQSPLPPGGTSFQAILANSRSGIQVTSKEDPAPCMTSPRENRATRLNRLQRQCKEFPSPKPVSATRRFTFDVV